MGFRGNEWGTKKNEANMKGGANVCGRSAAASYHFDSQGLFMGEYTIEPGADGNMDVRIEEHHSFVGLLTEVFGDPAHSTELWRSGAHTEAFYQSGSSKARGIALALGHLIFESLWETEDAIIICRLSGGGYSASHSIRYLDPNHSPDNVRIPSGTTGLDVTK